MKLKNGDNVVVITGKDKGKLGKIIKVNKLKNQVVVEGINFQTHHVKPTQKNPEGGLLREEGPINASNVMLNIGDTKVAKKAQVTRIKVSKTVKPNGKKISKRIAVKTGVEI